jgi:hypothetical protein
MSMKKELVKCKDHKTAKKRCPWAVKVTKVQGGFWCFENWDDYETWRKQK